MIISIQIISSSQYVHIPGSNIKYVNAIIWGVIMIDTQPQQSQQESSHLMKCVALVL